ncbi:MAG: glycerate kinase [Cyanobacteria bacterium]|jgi:D-glycerate 3-kinase|nr:glycerate kinase [Cyanobacteria bacterium GSL.Bin1]
MMPNNDLSLTLNKVINKQVITENEKTLLARSRFPFPKLDDNYSLKTQLDFFPTAYSTIQNYCSHVGLSETNSLELLWRLWLPLALQIVGKKNERSSAIIQGILGLQGTGKTTLSTLLSLLLNNLGYHTITLSIDDLYKTYTDRQQLQRDDPRLIWRGPPGTHDVNLGIELLDQIRNGKTPLSIPRFDKSAFHGMGDRATPEVINNKVDILLFEGWFVGVQPIPESVFQSPPPPIITIADRQFARDNNRRLEAYLPLWNRLDGLIILSPVDYRLSQIRKVPALTVVQQWRKEAEQKMVAQGKSGMTETEINQFVEYFWRALHPELFITPLIESQQGVDMVIEIDENHLPNHIHTPTVTLSIFPN